MTCRIVGLLPVLRRPAWASRWRVLVAARAPLTYGPACACTPIASPSLTSHSTSRQRSPGQNIAADLDRDVSSSPSLLLLRRNIPGTSAVTTTICDSQGVVAA